MRLQISRTAPRPAGNVDEALERELIADVLIAEASWRPTIDAESIRSVTPGTG